jgi:hypothetical protein
VDILEAYIWYENQEPGLGKALFTEFDAIVERIGEIPTAYATSQGLSLSCLGGRNNIPILRLSPASLSVLQ